MLRASTTPPIPSARQPVRLLGDGPAASIRIAFCGPIGEAGKPAGGGYEAANRRTCDALRRRGFEVAELPYPKLTASPLRRLLRYAASFARAGLYLLARRRDYDVLHLTPLNMHFAYAETLLISCARLAGKPVLLDVRAGKFVSHYESGGALYRRTIDRTLRQASQVSVEGQEFIPFIRQRTRRPVLHFPNFLDSPALLAAAPQRHLTTGEPVRLLYFGRLVPEKGVETALQALTVLLARGHSVQLEFIGDGPGRFVSQMQQRHGHLPVTWTASLPVDAILQRAGRAHFFFFASRHDGEGHSNALNEAMAVGLVPVCSPQGFTRSVVGDAGIVLPTGSTAADYAAAIEAVLADGSWGKLSERARMRVRTLYCEDKAVPALIEAYRSMPIRC